jgi:hypothetical protein
VVLETEGILQSVTHAPEVIVAGTQPKGAGRHGRQRERAAVGDECCSPKHTASEHHGMDATICTWWNAGDAALDRTYCSSFVARSAGF